MVGVLIANIVQVRREKIVKKGITQMIGELNILI